MNETHRTLYKNLNYHFQDDALIRMALTHRSYGHPNNERLEFLGDSVLNMVVAEIIYRRCPDLQEGALSRIRANYVKGEALAVIAKQLELGQYLYLGSGELKSGGRERHSILADTLEAVIGAMFLEAGLASCQTAIERWFAEPLSQIDHALANKDPKTQLQEYLQALQYPLPQYTVERTLGDPHHQQFVICCRVLELNCAAEGKGSSRRKAEQRAAAACLKRLQQDHLS